RKWPARYSKRSCESESTSVVVSCVSTTTSATRSSISLMRRRAGTGSLDTVMRTILGRPHPPQQPGERLLRVVRRATAPSSPVPGQHPVERNVAQFLHRADLLAPRVPADPSPSGQTALPVTPQVVAGKQDVPAKQQRRAAAGVAGDRDHEQVI